MCVNEIDPEKSVPDSSKWCCCGGAAGIADQTAADWVCLMKQGCQMKIHLMKSCCKKDSGTEFRNVLNHIFQNILGTIFFFSSHVILASFNTFYKFLQYI